MSKTKIPDDLKKEIRALQSNSKTQKAICYLTGLDLEEEMIEYDHVIPESQGGKTDISNIRIVNKTLNRKKSDKNLIEFKAQLEIEELFKNKKEITLSDLIIHKKITNKPIKISFDEEYAYFGEDCYKLFNCEKTNSKYFFAKIGYEYITNDVEDGLQPRNIDVKKLLELKDNFVNRPQLQPSIARFKNDKILLFDGQHKAGANLLNNSKKLELKIYVDDREDSKLFQTLMITNLEAHNKFKQTGFASSILMNKMKNVADSHFEEYLNLDIQVHSEKGYVDFLIDVKKFKRIEAEAIVKSYILESQIDSFGLKNLMIDRQRFDTSKKGISTNAFKKYFSMKFCRQSFIAEDFNEKLRDIENTNFNIITSMFKKYSVNQSETFTKRFLNVFSLEVVMSTVRDLTMIICEVMTESDRNNLLINLNLTSERELKLQKCVDYIYSHVIWIDESSSNFWRNNSTINLINYFEKNKLTVKDILLSINND
jgi:hypothetical protein